MEIFSSFVIWLLAVIVLIIGWRHIIEHHAQDHNWKPAYILSYVLLRVPIVLGASLFGFPILANTPIGSALFQNLFVMRNPWQLAAVMVSSTMAASMVSFVSELILEKAKARFDIPFLVTLSTAARYILTAILLLPTWVAAIWLSVAELTIGGVILGIFVGLLGSLGFIAVVCSIESLLKKQGLKQFFTDLIKVFVKWYPEGYLDKNGELSDGHLLGFVLAIIGLLVYILVIFLYQPEPKGIPYLGEAPALLYALLLIWIVTGLFSGANFYARFLITPMKFIKEDIKDLGSKGKEDNSQKRDRKALDFNTLYQGVVARARFNSSSS